MGRNNSKQSSNCCHCNSGSQYRYRNIGNSLHNTFLFIKRLSVFFIPFSKQNCIIYSGTQLDGTDNKICNIENVFSKPSTENAEQSASFLKGFRLVSALAIFLGAGMEMSLLWDLFDVLMGLWRSLTFRLF